MKRVLLLLVLVFTFNFVFASIDVNNYSVDGFYSPFENITGEINLTIVDGEYNALITSNDDDEISLGDFLNASGNLFECSPPDCSNDYSSSSGALSKSFSIPSSGEAYLGFVLTGKDVEVTSLSFDFESDFVVGARPPLAIGFFEGEDWIFGEFSDQFLEEDWGCYDSASRTDGPLIGKSLYCEMIYIPDSGAIKVGAVVSGSDDIGLNMTVFPEAGSGASWDCSYDPNVTDGCVIASEFNYIFSSGYYQVCVNADNTTKYNIYNEEVGDTCGFIYEAGPTNSSKDYAIYAQGAKYAAASSLGSIDFGTEDIIGAANRLLLERYSGDCSSGCVLPLSFSGVSQEAIISDILLEFEINNGELYSANNIYDLDIIPVTVDFEGVLDLSALGFSVSKTMEYIVSFGSIDLFSELLDVLPAPIILTIFPLDPPAGVPIRFYAGVDYADNKSLTYKWDFGDNDTQTTDGPYAMHTYSNLGNYTLDLEVSAGGNLTSEKTFTISAVSPEVAINASLISRRDALDSFIAKLAEFPSWYSTPLGELIKIASFESELDRLDRLQANAFIESDFIDIAGDLYALDVPTILGVENFNSPYFNTNIADVDIEPVEIISGSVSGATSEDYAGPILNWQAASIDASFSTNKFSVMTYGNAQSDVFRTYKFNIKMMSDRENYFVINKPFSELFFKEGVGARKAGNATVVILQAGSNTSLEFYYKSAEPVTFFVSPKLSSIVIEADIDTTCNHNMVCEEDLGEDPSTCRSDCKPVGGAILYIIISLFFVFILYSVLQIWYKRRYENFLFKDKTQLYNLLMYVTNARARGMSDSRIAAELRSQGWSSERVNYIIKKSIGKRTGLYEIVPFEKISAYLRNRKAKKIQAAKSPARPGFQVATGTQQQMRRNINKSGFPRRV